MKIKIFTFVKILVFIAVVIFLAILGQGLVSTFVSGPRFVHISMELLSAVIASGVYILFTRFIDRKKVMDGVLFPSGGRLKPLGKGCLLGIAMMTLSLGILHAGGWLALIPRGLGAGDILLYVLTALVAMIFTAFWEELVFRGYALVELETIFGKHGACFFVALSFGLLHLFSPIKSFQIVISTVLSGLLLSYAYMRDRNLYFPIGIHLAWNFMNNVFFGGKIWEMKIIAPFFAGDKNPEEGLVAIVITGLAVLWVVFFVGRDPGRGSNCGEEHRISR